MHSPWLASSFSLKVSNIVSTLIFVLASIPFPLLSVLMFVVFVVEEPESGDGSTLVMIKTIISSSLGLSINNVVSVTLMREIVCLMDAE